MENSTFLMLTLSSASLIAGITLYMVKPNVALRLRGGICLVLAAQTFALFQITQTFDTYPSVWVLSLGLWPLLPSLIMHLMLVKYGPLPRFSLSISKKIIYLPSFLFLGIGLIFPRHFYEITTQGEAGLYPILGSPIVKLQLSWLLLLSAMLLYYMLSKKISSSHLFSEVIIWCVPIAFLLLARFTCAITPHGLIEMFWLPVGIPVAGGFWHAYHHYSNSKKLNGNMASSITEIMIHTDEKGRILQANNHSMKQLGYNAKEMNRHHINNLFPDLRINLTGEDMLTYMKRPNHQRIPVKVVINAIPGERGYLITGCSIL